MNLICNGFVRSVMGGEVGGSMSNVDARGPVVDIRPEYKKMKVWGSRIRGRGNNKSRA